MNEKNFEILWTKVDEAPYLATFAFLPPVRKILEKANININIKDISLSARVLAQFQDYLREDQRVSDYLAELGELVLKDPSIDLVKLPNISATIPQLTDTIKELQKKGYNIPDYVEEPKNEEEKNIKERYSKVIGSAVNPVLRQGNNIRMIPNPVKESARKFPDLMGLPLKEWESGCKSHVSYMEKGDFFENEKSIATASSRDVRIVFSDTSGNSKELKKVLLSEGEILDSTFMSVKDLQEFYDKQIQDAKEKGVLWSLHLKATMMKVSDPVIFGYAVKRYFKDVFDKYEKVFNEIGFKPEYGLNSLYSKLDNLPKDLKEDIERDIEVVYKKNPPMMMVDSKKGITNLHSPNLVIIDASLPPIIRDGGRTWGPDNNLHDVKIIIPDRCYAPIYDEIIEDCKKNGAFDRKTMGSVINIGLMAMKAEEYGSHDKTFMAPSDGKFEIVDENGNILMEHRVNEGDIFRACQVKDVAVKNWIKLALEQAKSTGYSTIFWLNEERAHDAQIIKKIKEYLSDKDTNDVDIRILKPQEAMKFTVKKIRNGENVIAVTGNVLRDYLTDLFPILEVGTSAKVLSIIPLLLGGRLIEAGAGGSAPRHVWQFLEEGHLRWDSTAEYTALTSALRFIEEKFGYKRAKVLADASEKAITKMLLNKQWPSRKVGELDNRGQHYYFIRYMLEELTQQNEDSELKELFKKAVKELVDNEKIINDELLSAQGKPVDIGGYYFPDEDKVKKAMNPSNTLNRIIGSL
ncbi:MAG: NADP-dependent isocitrate dehydrogenase [Deferribacterota bacterium]|nr:NADP-dependent isocitrate dehydrogenase [Deferribacterota bacterium]